MEKLTGKRILVTGGGGFVGTNVVKRLVAEHAVVRATCHSDKPRYPIEGAEYVRADLTEKEDCLRVTKGVDAVVMTAAFFVSGAQGMQSNPMRQVTDTMILNLRMLEAMLENGVKKCVFISTSMVYPFSDKPLKEEDGFTGDPYEKYFTGGWTRRCVETVCRMYAEKLKAMDITVLRIDNLYGPYDHFERNKSHVIAALIRKTVERMDPLEVWGDGKDYKDFIFIEDLVDGVVLALEKADGYRVYNLASGRNVTINDALKIILRCGGYEDANILHKNDMPTMIPYKVLCVDKIQNELGFTAKTSLEEGLRRTIDWYRQNPATDE